MNDQEIEQEVQAKGLTAPRLSPADLDANIAHIEIVKHVSNSGQVLRWAVLTTQNGFAVAGKPSVAVSPENDNAEIGEKVAIANSRNELWPLMGYALKEQLHQRVGSLETKTYADGTTAIGTAPLPGASPVVDRSPTTGLNFGTVLHALKAGKRVARAGWNGKGMFVYVVPANSYPAQTGAAKAFFGEDGMVPYNAYLALKGADDTVSTWAPSGSDALAEDWLIVE